VVARPLLSVYPYTGRLSKQQAELTKAVCQAQGVTLVHFSAQLEPCLEQENSLNTINTP